MQIRLKQGVVRGREETSVPSRNFYYSFYGIPFAEPPVDSLRFQAPQPHRGWNGILDATQKPEICIQRNMITNKFVGSEDCLYLNVHVPENPTKNELPKPVMVFIHGGVFYMGSGAMYSPEYLMEYDVIVVTFNYRLHVLGFLNLGLPECPGNVGLKDQVMALKWVRENIRAFGGDDSNITVFGESAGSASVHYLMISPMGRGLFDRAILQSGYSCSPWAFNKEPLTWAFEIGAVLGYTGNSSNRKGLLQFLLKIPATELTIAQFKCLKKAASCLFYHPLPFAPSVEFDIDSSQAFLPDTPEILLKTVRPIPLMAGLNDLEGLIILGQDVERINIDLTIHPERLVPPEWQTIPSVLPDIASQIQKFYFPNEKVLSKQCLEQIVHMLTDIDFSRHFYDAPKMILNQDSSTPIYIYKFSYEGKLNILKQVCLMPFGDCDMIGSCHGDELFYLFKLDGMSEMIDDAYELESQCIDTLCRLWTNFAKYGTPSPKLSSIKWTPTSVDKPCYLHINNAPEMKTGLIDEERQAFWASLTTEVESRKKSIEPKL